MDSRHPELTYESVYQQLKADCRALDANHPCSEEYLSTLTTRYYNLIEQFELLPDVTFDHYQQLINISCLLAIYHFNTNHFLGASNFYLCTIQCLEHTECTANDFREIVRYSLDLAECYMYIARKDLAQKAIDLAIKAFHAIDFLSKTTAEDEIDPTQDFSKFYHHYQALSSTRRHLNSTAFKNNTMLINLMIEKNASDKQMQDVENAILQLSLYDNQDNKEETNLCNMLEAITLDHEAILRGEVSELDSSFTDEDATRRQIGEYLKLALQHRDKQDIKSQMETYEQILQLYNIMPSKTPTDLGVIRSITEQKNKYTQSLHAPRLFYKPPQPTISSSSPMPSNRMDLS